MIAGAFRALLGVAERALSTPMPEPADRTCPGCGLSLRFACRVVAESRDLHGDPVHEVRCAVCATRSRWRWFGGFPCGQPELIEPESRARQRVSA